MTTEWEKIDKYAKDWISEAGDKIKHSFSRELVIQTKSNQNDLVTDIDKETEQFFIEKIHASFPNHRIMGEEGFGDSFTDLKGVVWIIDPIDGTMNFIHQQKNFAISIGIYEDGIGQLAYIYDVVHNEFYCAQKGKGAYLNEVKLTFLEQGDLSSAIIGLNATWVTENRLIDPTILAPLVRDVRGTRSYGSAAIEIASVAAGRLDAYITLRLAPWDFAAGKIIVEELGGMVTNLRGEPLNLLEKNSILISKPSLHQIILEKYLENGKW